MIGILPKVPQLLQHVFDDQGTLELHQRSMEASGVSAQAFVRRVYELVGRPFAARKHLPAATRQTHLGLLHELGTFLRERVYPAARGES